MSQQLLTALQYASYCHYMCWRQIFQSNYILAYSPITQLVDLMSSKYRAFYDDEGKIIVNLLVKLFLSNTFQLIFFRKLFLMSSAIVFSSSGIILILRKSASDNRYIYISITTTLRVHYDVKVLDLDEIEPVNDTVRQEDARLWVGKP